jgi:hypothetical protein
MIKFVAAAALAVGIAGSASAQGMTPMPSSSMPDPAQDVRNAIRAVDEQNQATNRGSRERSARTEALSDAQVIAVLKDLQTRLRAGENVVFELLSGAPASYEMTRVSPRDAFLQLDFAQARAIERVPTANRLWQSYRLKVLPDGPGRPLWEVELIVGAGGNAERVSMVYKPPAPF